MPFASKKQFRLAQATAHGRGEKAGMSRPAAARMIAHHRKSGGRSGSLPERSTQAAQAARRKP